ncbi:MAG: hypothetical protein ONB05_07955, partial [candidate division KSB1 bacterium]|nr:hypothetical protein [candidate division KSB1 bacterium]
NYPADTRYLVLPTPNDSSIYWGRPTYLDNKLKAGTIPEKRILASLLPQVQPLSFVPFQNMSYVPCGLTVTKDWEQQPQHNRLYLALSWKDTTENKTRRPSIIAEMVIEEERLQLQRYFYLRDELQDHRISGIAYFKNLSEEYLFILSAEKDPEAGYQILGQYELRKTRHFANPFWPKRFWKIRLDAGANDTMAGGQAWMSCEKKGPDTYLLWIGSFAHGKAPGLTPDSSETARLYQFLLTHRGNLLDPLTQKEVVISGSKVTYHKLWELPFYKKELSDSVFYDINGGTWYYQDDQKYFILAVGYGDEINYLKKYPFDEESGFGECQGCLPVPAGTREIDLLSDSRIISVSASGCRYLQTRQRPPAWARTYFPFIFSVELSDVSQKCP